ncbi:hypothetical protein HPG69_004222 [Diceros bicornis minor]|uniref:Uncharacterized protein n=1 Tax=Diceros bicornis minor TaxID=77932 RepID=A0A7J7E9P1_DICBM|nr:hypothetical protein HPG69_004222 [Diceros bicornis minor]
MCILKLPVVLIALSVALNHPKATPIERLWLINLSDGTSDRQEWIVPVLSRNMLLELRGTKPELEAGKAKT